jgi:VWFA-related protein
MSRLRVSAVRAPCRGRAWRITARALAVVAGLFALAAAEGVKFEFVTPKHQQTVLGESRIELGVSVPAPLVPSKIEIRVDGAPLATLTAPPWSAVWDAGMIGQAHTLEAVLYLSDGTEIRRSIRTSALRVNYVEEVALVNLYAVVRNAAGDYVTDLGEEDFAIVENGRPQKIDRFTTEHKPLRVALVLDNSLSMQKEDRLKHAQDAALSFLDVLTEGDEGMVVAFSDEVVVKQEATAAREDLERAILSVVPVGGTALYDAVWKTSRQLERLDGRRVMVLLSDGRDEAKSGLEPGSLHTLNEALDRALRDEVIIFSIGTGNNLDSQPDFYGRTSLQAILQEMADKTGGRAYFARGATRLKKAFEEVADDLRHMYSLAYVSDDARHDGTWRAVKLTTDDPKLLVYTREGYFAPAEAASPTGTH